MSDPVAEAAAALAARQAEPSLIDEIKDGMHDLAEKVEHLIHPEADAGNAGSPVAETTSATGAITSAQPAVEASGSVALVPSASIEAAENRSDEAPNVSDSSTGTLPESKPSAITSTVQTAETIPTSAIVASTETTELPNAVSGAAESTTVTASAPPASGNGETSSIGASSGEDPNAGGTTATATVDSAVTATPTSNSASRQGGQSTTLELAQASSRVIDSPLHVRIAAHLEAIYSLAKTAPVAAVADTSTLKAHVGDILHRISNGMQVTEGELVQKLEALYRML
ncbi:hypothetical protein ABH944_004845 [Caballeronia udeis]|uniref:Chemotaxis protein CheA n=1 Tax=Caballeronia udeis TaxID=1232866 RepID=A0ABW8MLU2_9BURK